MLAFDMDEATWQSPTLNFDVSEDAYFGAGGKRGCALARRRALVLSRGRVCD